MKIAIFNPYKNKYAAENAVDFEYKKIIKISNLEIQIKPFCSTEEIVEFNPDFILSHSNFCPKFCHIPTYIIFNEPTSYRLKNEDDIRSYLTFDGYLTQSKYISQKINDLCFYYGKKLNIINNFANTRSAYCFNEDLSLDNIRITYCGNNWEVKTGDDKGNKAPRFKTLFEELITLIDHESIELYGDPSGWQWLGVNKLIKGQVSFSDSDALLKIYRKNGVGLALSSHQFFEEGLANNRIYEICAAGAVCIADDLPFYREFFGDNLLYVTSRDELEMAKQITQHLKWIKANPEQAKEKAKNAHRIFCQKLSMEKMLENLIEFHHKVQKDNFHSIGYSSNNKKNPVVSVIVRSGGREISMVKRAIDSICSQTYKEIELIFVLYQKNDELEELAKGYANRFSSLKIVHSLSNIRSSVMISGLKEISGEYFAFLDDDDIWYKNHLSKIMEFFEDNIDADFVYSGRVYYNENGFFERKKDIQGGASTFRDILYDLKILTNSDSRYCLGGFGKTDYNEMMRLIQPIHNCFVVKSSTLRNSKITQDPILHHAEDLYFCVLLYSLGFKFYWMPDITVQINIHDANSFCSEKESVECRDKIATRVFGICNYDMLLNLRDKYNQKHIKNLEEILLQINDDMLLNLRDNYNQKHIKNLEETLLQINDKIKNLDQRRFKSLKITVSKIRNFLRIIRGKEIRKKH